MSNAQTKALCDNFEMIILYGIQAQDYLES
jgi:hypothetical protein